MAGRPEPIVPSDALAACDLPAVFTGTEAGDALEAALCVFVVTRDPQGRTRRRPYLNLPSAERAVDRAAERGDAAQLVLVRLVPVGGEVR